MSKRIYSTEASIGASEFCGELAVEFCDASVAQWSEPAGPLSDWGDDEELAAMIADSIRDNADDLAESIVRSLRVRVAAETEKAGHR